MRDGMSQRLEYRSLCPDRLMPRYILDRQTRRQQREFTDSSLRWDASSC